MDALLQWQNLVLLFALIAMLIFRHDLVSTQRELDEALKETAQWKRRHELLLDDITLAHKRVSTQRSLHKQQLLEARVQLQPAIQQLEDWLNGDRSAQVSPGVLSERLRLVSSVLARKHA